MTGVNDDTGQSNKSRQSVGLYQVVSLLHSTEADGTSVMYTHSELSELKHVHPASNGDLDIGYRFNRTRRSSVGLVLSRV